MRLSFSSRHRSGSRRGLEMKRYVLIVSPCIVPLLIWIGGVALKWLPGKEVVEFVYMLPISLLHLLGSLKDE